MVVYQFWLLFIKLLWCISTVVLSWSTDYQDLGYLWLLWTALFYSTVHMYINLHCCVYLLGWFLITGTCDQLVEVIPYTRGCAYNQVPYFITFSIRCHRQVILGHFLPLQSPDNPENQNFKIEKTPGHIILHICTINGNHLIYGSWDMEHDRQKFFVILDCFLPFYPPMEPENQNF